MARKFFSAGLSAGLPQGNQSDIPSVLDIQQRAALLASIDPQVREAAMAATQQKPNTFITRIFGLLDKPRSAVFNTFFDPLVEGDQDTFGELIEAAAPNAPLWLKRGVGFVGDVATDPLTYVTGGAAGLGKQAAQRAVFSNLARKTGGEAVEKALREGGEQAFRKLVLDDENLSRLASQVYGDVGAPKTLSQTLASLTPEQRAMLPKHLQGGVQFRVPLGRTLTGEVKAVRLLPHQLTSKVSVPFSSVVKQNKGSRALARTFSTGEKAREFGYRGVLANEAMRQHVRWSGDVVDEARKVLNNVAKVFPANDDTSLNTLRQALDRPEVYGSLEDKQRLAVDSVREVLDTLRGYAEEAGLEVGYLDNYFPRRLSKEAVSRKYGPVPDPVGKKPYQSAVPTSARQRKTATLSFDEADAALAHQYGLDGSFFEKNPYNAILGHVQETAKKVAEKRAFNELEDVGLFLPDVAEAFGGLKRTLLKKYKFTDSKGRASVAKAMKAFYDDARATEVDDFNRRQLERSRFVLGHPSGDSVWYHGTSAGEGKFSGILEMAFDPDDIGKVTTTADWNVYYGPHFGDVGSSRKFAITNPDYHPKAANFDETVKWHGARPVDRPRILRVEVNSKKPKFYESEDEHAEDLARFLLEEDLVTGHNATRLAEVLDRGPTELGHVSSTMRAVSSEIGSKPFRDLVAQHRRNLQREGYDAIVYKNDYEGGWAVIPFEARTLKEMPSHVPGAKLSKAAQPRLNDAPDLAGRLGTPKTFGEVEHLHWKNWHFDHGLPDVESWLLLHFLKKDEVNGLRRIADAFTDYVADNPHNTVAAGYAKIIPALAAKTPRQAPGRFIGGSGLQSTQTFVGTLVDLLAYDPNFSKDILQRLYGSFDSKAVNDLLLSFKKSQLQKGFRGIQFIDSAGVKSYIDFDVPPSTNVVPPASGFKPAVTRDPRVARMLEEDPGAAGILQGLAETTRTKVGRQKLSTLGKQARSAQAAARAELLADKALRAAHKRLGDRGLLMKKLWQLEEDLKTAQAEIPTLKDNIKTREDLIKDMQRDLKSPDMDSLTAVQVRERVKIYKDAIAKDKRALAKYEKFINTKHPAEKTRLQQRLDEKNARLEKDADLVEKRRKRVEHVESRLDELDQHLANLDSGLDKDGSDWPLNVTWTNNPPPGYRQIRDTVLSGANGGWAPGPVADEFEALFTRKGAATLTREYDKFLGYFRKYVTIPFPGFHFRNLIGGWVNNHMGGVVLGDYAMARRIWGRDALDDSVDLTEMGLPGWTAGDLRARAKEQGVLSSKGGPLGELSQEGPKQYLPGRPMGRYMDKMSNVAQATEDFLRTASFVAGVRMTGDPVAARYFTVVRHGDYSELTQGEEWLRRFIPFYRWSRMNIPLQFSQLMEAPGKVLNIEKGKQAFFGDSDDESTFYDKGGFLPQSVAERGGFFAGGLLDMFGGLPGAEEGAGLILQPDLPVYDLNKLEFSPRALLQNVLGESIASNIIETATNKRLRTPGDIKEHTPVHGPLKVLALGFEKVPGLRGLTRRTRSGELWLNTNITQMLGTLPGTRITQLAEDLGSMESAAGAATSFAVGIRPIQTTPEYVERTRLGPEMDLREVARDLYRRGYGDVLENAQQNRRAIFTLGARR